MQSFTFKCPTEIVFGKGAEEKVPEKLKAYGATKILIVYGGGSVVRSGLLGRIESALTAAGLVFTSIGGVKPNPRVGLVNIGVEEEKGNALAKETFPLLKACPGINFVGNVESREIPHGAADVYVTEAFTGNVILKLYEGLAMTLLSNIKRGIYSSTRAKIGGLLIKPALKKTLKTFDVNHYGGAPLLGLKGLVVKTHGTADAEIVRNTIFQCVTFNEEQINEKIKQRLFPEEEKNDGI